MIEYCVFYVNGERYIVRGSDPRRFDKSLPPGRSWDDPDEVKLIGWPLIKRDKKLDEMTKEQLREYGSMALFAAKDIPLSRAMPKEWK